MQVRTLIIGGGVMGTSIAMHVARRSAPLTEPVLLLERSRLAAGSSGRSGAILRQHYAERELAGMARDSLRQYAGFEGQTGYPVGFQACGVLTLAGPGDHEARELVRSNVELQRGLGIDTRLVDAAGMRGLVRGIEVAEGALGAYEQSAGVCDPKLTVESFASVARYHGATTRCGVEVLELLMDGGRVHGVRTSTETIEAQQVVLAAGAWSGSLLAPLGIELPLRILAPEQHFVETLEVPRALLTRAQEQGLGDSEFEERFGRSRAPGVHAHPVILDLETGHYSRCEPDADRTRVGRMDYARAARLTHPAELSETVSADFQGRARQALVQRLPAYTRQQDTGGQSGWYTVTPDARPVLGPWPGVEGLFLAAGFSGHGFKLAPSVGLGLTQQLRGEPVSAFDTEFFAPGRFGDGPATWGERYGL